MLTVILEYILCFLACFMSFCLACFIYRTASQIAIRLERKFFK